MKIIENRLDELKTLINTTKFQKNLKELKYFFNQNIELLKKVSPRSSLLEEMTLFQKTFSEELQPSEAFKGQKN